MPPKFGTSGLRGLVTELTRGLVQNYTQAFLSACPTGGAVFVGRDLRPSSPEIAEWVMQTVEAAGMPAVDCGAVPTPALALAALEAGQAAVMVTGSHIPADRNGLKFYTPKGEILKEDETRILAGLGVQHPKAPAPQRRAIDAVAGYANRYVDAFGDAALRGLRIGVYQHSSVARDIMVNVLSRLGAETVSLARSDVFIPVDTEALDQGTRQMLAGWCAEHGLDAIVSTDGDADRPMVTDASGRIVPGDILGALTARMLGARIICTPVSSNSMIAQMPEFDTVALTRIGSPYVIAAMEEALARDADSAVVGYEANGGFLLGFRGQAMTGSLAPLMTRDCLLSIVAPLAEANKASVGLAALVANLPPVFTAADRITEVPTDWSKAFIADLTDTPERRAAFFDSMGPETRMDTTDGLRLTFAGDEVVHLRPSGNAPEFRCYAEAGSADRAAELVSMFLARIRTALDA